MTQPAAIYLCPSEEELAAGSSRRCAICQRTFASEGTCRSHAVRRHGASLSKPPSASARFLCPKPGCKYGSTQRHFYFASAKLLRQHLAKAHAEKRLHCGYCETFKCALPRDLRYHQARCPRRPGPQQLPLVTLLVLPPSAPLPAASLPRRLAPMRVCQARATTASSGATSTATQTRSPAVKRRVKSRGTQLSVDELALVAQSPSPPPLPLPSVDAAVSANIGARSSSLWFASAEVEQAAAFGLDLGDDANTQTDELRAFDEFFCNTETQTFYEQLMSDALTQTADFRADHRAFSSSHTQTPV